MKYLLALALAAISATSYAKEVTYTFSSVFGAPSRYTTMMGGENDEPLFLGLIKEGDHFSGQFTYDSDAAVQEVTDFNSFKAARYPALNFQIQASSAFNSAVTWTGPTIDVQHNLPYNGYAAYSDSLSAGAGANIGPKGDHLLTIHSGGDVPNGTFADLKLPVDQDGLTQGSIFLYMYDFNAPHYSVDFVSSNIDIRLAQVSPVPEPSPGSMMSAALACMGGLAALRRRSR